MSLEARISKAESLEELRGLSSGYAGFNPDILIEFSNAYYDLKDVDTSLDYADRALYILREKEQDKDYLAERVAKVDCITAKSSQYDYDKEQKNILMRLKDRYRNEPEIFDVILKKLMERYNGNTEKLSEIIESVNGTNYWSKKKYNNDQGHQKTSINWDDDWNITLEMEDTNDFEKVKKQYRKLAFRYHPDRNPGDKIAEEKFKLLGKALEEARDKILGQL